MSIPCIDSSSQQNCSMTCVVSNSIETICPLAAICIVIRFSNSAQLSRACAKCSVVILVFLRVASLCRWLMFAVAVFTLTIMFFHGSHRLL